MIFQLCSSTCKKKKKKKNHKFALQAIKYNYHNYTLDRPTYKKYVSAARSGWLALYESQALWHYGSTRVRYNLQYYKFWKLHHNSRQRIYNLSRGYGKNENINMKCRPFANNKQRIAAHNSVVLDVLHLPGGRTHSAIFAVRAHRRCALNQRNMRHKLDD